MNASPGSKRVLGLAVTALLLSVLIPLSAEKAEAVPSFARKYKTSCSTCHYAYPKLNAFGKAYRNNGFRYPEGQDPEMMKEEPVSLGSESYKRVWPDAIWPTDIPGTPPISIHAFGRFLFFEENDQATFEIPHEMEILFGGTFDDKISYFGEVELEHEAEVAYEFMVQYDFDPALHVKLGSVGPDQATPEHLRLTKEHYNVVSFKNQSGTWRLRDGAGGGVEVWGACNGPGGRGGLTYSAGVGNGQNDEDNFDLNKKKDLFGRATYKVGGLGETGGTEGQASAQSAFYVDNSVRFGGFGYLGTAVKDGKEDDFFVLGGDIDLWYDRLIVTAAGLVMQSDYLDKERDSFAAFAEGHYVIYPWLIGYGRYEYTDTNTDDVVDAEQSVIPAVIAMVRANVKCSAEYKVPLDDASEDTGGFTIQFNFAF